jgi:hypothetical protein
MARRLFNRNPPAVPTHWTLKPNGGVGYKGTYYRRLEDIGEALKTVDDAKRMKGGQFLYLYYGCEKLGRGIVGIANEWDAEDAYHGNRGLALADLKAAAGSMNIPATMADLDTIFDASSNTSARHLRNEIVHNFGPWNVENAIKESAVLNRVMHDFLTGSTPAVLAYLKAKYLHLLP